MHRLARILAPLTAAAVLLGAPARTASAQLPTDVGLLILAHGGSASWNAHVTALADSLGSSRPVEVAFGMASRAPIQAAVDRLADRGARRIVAVPLFVSSHSSVIASTQYLLGLRETMPADLAVFAKMSHGPHGGEHEHHVQAPVEDGTRPIVSRVPIVMTSALDHHPIVARILVDRAGAISTVPANEAVVLVAHGPTRDDENALWLQEMEQLATQMTQMTQMAQITQRTQMDGTGGFARIDWLTVRDDAPEPIRSEATAELRALVERRIREGRRVLVVPLLMSYGGIEQGIRKRLEGLDYTMATQGLMPDARLADWVKAVAADALR